MTAKYWLALSPSLLLGAGIIVATYVAVLTGESEWLVLAGPLLLALSVVSADALDARLRGDFSRPSWAALIMGASFILAGLIVNLRDPSSVATLIPIVGAAGWVAIPRRSKDGRNTCGGL